MQDSNLAKHTTKKDATTTVQNVPHGVDKWYFKCWSSCPSPALHLKVGGPQQYQQQPLEMLKVYA